MNSRAEMAEPGPYTTITVTEFNRLSATLIHLRKRIQKVRELLELGKTVEALQIVKFEDDELDS